MAKGKRHNSQKKKNNSKGDEENDNGIDDEAGVKKCPHLSKGVKSTPLQNKVPHATLGKCSDCDDTNSSEGVGVWICLSCANQGCDRYSDEKHALAHNQSNPSHSIVVHLQNWVVWCYSCDDEVSIEPDSTLHNSIKMLLKAMNLSTPPGLRIHVDEPPPSPKKTLSSLFTVQKEDGPSAKNSTRSRDHIKGLSNLGNTCFFNAVVQNLCQTDLLHVALSCAVQKEFSQLVCTGDKDMLPLSVTVQEGSGPVTSALWKLLSDVRSSNDRVLNPRQLFGEICKKATRFKGYRQQDSQELLRYLLDSIRTEELRRVKMGILKTFGVNAGGDAKSLDENERAHVKEYGASAEAPLVDSVFAGQLVSVVICHQCHQEFKVEETFLDLSLPLTAPQESNGSKLFTRVGKQNHQLPKTSANNSSTINLNSDTEKDAKAKSPSKHQQKSAKRAERKKKKGKSHGGKKGKVAPEPNEDKQDEKNGEGEEEKCEKGDGVGQTNACDKEEYDNDKESRRPASTCSDTRNEENKGSESKVIPEKKNGEKEGEMEMHVLGVPNCEEKCAAESLDSNKLAYTSESESQPLIHQNEETTLSSSEGGLELSDIKLTESIPAEMKESENYSNQEITISLQENEGRSEVSNVEGGSKECSKLVQDVKCEASENSTTEFLHCNSRDVSTEGTAASSQRDTTEVEQDPTKEVLLQANCDKREIGNEHGGCQNEPHVLLENVGTSESLSLCANEIVEKVDKLTLNSAKEDANCIKNNQNVSSVRDKKSSLGLRGSTLGDCGIHDVGNGSLATDIVSIDNENSACSMVAEDSSLEPEIVSASRKDSTEPEIITASNEVSSGSLENKVASCSSENTSGTSGTADSLLQEAGGKPVNNDVCIQVSKEFAKTRDCNAQVQENDIAEKTDQSGNSCPGSTTENTAEDVNEDELSSESESDSEDEEDHGSPKTLTLQPAYRPSHGECSVMSSLSQFCSSEVLSGSNKFACEECSKRAQRLRKGGEGGGSQTVRAADVQEKDGDDVDGVSSDSSSEDGSEGAKAPKSKKKQSNDSKHETVYTEASKQLLISLAPPVLTLHLKRFQQARFSLRKITKHVDFPLLLDLAPFCSRSGRSRADSEGRVLYSLYGVVEHSGSLNSGHYTAYVKVRDAPKRGLYDKITCMSELTAFIKNMWTQKTSKHSAFCHEPAADGQWFHVSDGSVVSVAEARVLKGQAYMLFYGRLPLASS